MEARLAPAEVLTYVPTRLPARNRLNRLQASPGIGESILPRSGGWQAKFARLSRAADRLHAGRRKGSGALRVRAEVGDAPEDARAGLSKHAGVWRLDDAGAGREGKVPFARRTDSKAGIGPSKRIVSVAGSAPGQVLTLEQEAAPRDAGAFGLGLSAEGVRAFIGCILINLVSGSFYCWTCYLQPMEAHTGVGRTLLSSVFSATLALFTFAASWIWPALAKRLSSSQIGLWTTVLSAAGVALCSLAGTTTATSVPLLFVGFAACFGLGSGLQYGLTIALANSELFASCKGLSTGFIISARSAGPAMLAPVVEHMVHSWGVLAAFQAHALLLLVGGALPAVWLLPRESKPKGSSLLAGAAAVAKDSWANFTLTIRGGRAEGARAGGGRERDGLPLLWTRGALWCSAFSALLLLSHAATMVAHAGGSLLQVAAAVSTANACSALGRILGGMIVDRTPPAWSIIAAPLVTLGPLLWAAAFPSVLAAQVALAAGGLAYGIGIIAVPVHVSNMCGLSGKNFPQTYGQIFLAWGVAGLLAPTVGGYLYEVCGNYSVALALAAAANVLQAVCGREILRASPEPSKAT